LSARPTFVARRPDAKRANSELKDFILSGQPTAAANIFLGVSFGPQLPNFMVRSHLSNQGKNGLVLLNVSSSQFALEQAQRTPIQRSAPS
jgi:hypothetical protein